MIPTPGFRDLHALVRALRTEEQPAPVIRAKGIQLAWKNASNREGRIVVSRTDAGSAFAVLGYIEADGSIVRRKVCAAIGVIALRNLAADPERRLRRYGFDEQSCPFCGVNLAYGTLDFGLGHCLRCGELLGWPLDQFTVDCAEDDLREDIAHEAEEEEQGG